MLYRRFGKTELMLPVLTLGGMRFLKGWEGPHDQVPDDMLQNTYEVTQHALNVGINHFETARGYGRSERAYGEIWPQLKKPGEAKSELRQRLIFTTKISPIPTYKKMRLAIEDSLNFLQIDTIDNFDIHGLNSEKQYDIVFKQKGCLDAVQDAMNEGLIQHLGFSTHAPLPIMIKFIETGVFESINLHYYYFFQRNWPAIELAAKKDMGVFIISPNDKGGQLFNPPQKLAELTAPLTPMNFNDRFCLSHPEIHTLSLGANETEHIDTHLSSVIPEIEQDTEPHSPFVKIKKQVDEPSEQFKELGKQHCTLCHECLPCPETINIPEILRYRNMWKTYDMTQFASYRYNMFEKNLGDYHPGVFANHCTECGDCLPRCPEKLPIPQFLKEVHDQFYEPTSKKGH